ncbi:Carboxylesterase NlhH [compost metagenome]
MGEALERFIEPDTAALLADMGADFAGAPVEPTVEQRRQGLEVAAMLYGPEPAEVERVATEAAPSSDGSVPLRIYWPKRTTAGSVPLVLHIHGGGWVLGGPQAYERVVRAYCAAGECIVVDVDYRRAPEHQHPAALEDCLAALDWAQRNARRLGADPARIVVTGDSAGGHLAAATCQVSPVPVALAILVYPVMTASRTAQLASRSALGDGRYFLREFDILRAEVEYFEPDQDREHSPASPLQASRDVLERHPPTVVFTASLDPLVDEGRAYVEALQGCGVTAEEVRTEGTIHGFILFCGRIRAGREAIKQIGQRIAAV